MAVTAAMFGTFPEFILGGNATAPAQVINMRTAAFQKCALYTSSWSPTQDSDTVYSGTNEVANGNGYTTAGMSLGTCTVSTPSTRVVTFDSPVDPTWTTSTITAHRALVYMDGDSTDRVVSWVDFGADVSSSSGDFKITWSASGIFTITVAALA